MRVCACLWFVAEANIAATNPSVSEAAAAAAAAADATVPATGVESDTALPVA